MNIAPTAYEYPAAPERLCYLREALQIIRKMWTEEEAGAQEVMIYLQDAAQLDSVRLFGEECLVR